MYICAGIRNDFLDNISNKAKTKNRSFEISVLCFYFGLFYWTAHLYHGYISSPRMAFLLLKSSDMHQIPARPIRAYNIRLTVAP